GGGEVRQHPVGRVLPPGRAPHAEPHPGVLPGGERPGDRPQPVVAALAPALPSPQGAERQVHLVVHGQYPLRRDLVEPDQPGYRPTGEVHVRHRLGEHHRRPPVPQAALGHLRHHPLVPAEAEVVPAGEQVRDEEAGVVPVAGVLPPGVAEPDHQPPRTVGPGRGRTGEGGHEAPDQLDAASPAAAPSGAGSTASAGASPASAAICSAVGATLTTAITVSGSAASSAPGGRVSSAAVTRSPTSRPSTDASTRSGSCVASALTAIRSCSWITSVPLAASPTRWTGTSTVTFSPRRTSSRSAWSEVFRIGCRWIALGRAVAWLPSDSSSV